MEIREFLRILKKSWVSVLVVTLLGVGLSAVWSFTRTPQYEATTQLYVRVKPEEVDVSPGQSLGFGLQSVGSYAAIANTSIVMDQVVKKLALPISATDLAQRVKVQVRRALP